jgi:hypothetical protein
MEHRQDTDDVLLQVGAGSSSDEVKRDLVKRDGQAHQNKRGPEMNHAAALSTVSSTVFSPAMGWGGIPGEADLVGLLRGRWAGAHPGSRGPR